MFVLHDLEEVHPSDQRQRQRRHHQGGEYYPTLDNPGITGVVFQMNRAGHVSLVVRVAIENCPGPVELFRQQNPYQRVR